MAMLDAGEWNTELKRRVQHFGYRYDYKARAITADAYLSKLPAWLEIFAVWLKQDTAGVCPIRSSQTNISPDRASARMSTVFRALTTR
ncbi:hypothetical protein [Agrobacterium tumefaciens]|uniref:hypothetical protein n=1 Tax=Agrobacterium tumefaciens TaxID=358 RepID=UPI001F1FE884